MSGESKKKVIRKSHRPTGENKFNLLSNEWMENMGGSENIEEVEDEFVDVPEGDPILDRIKKSSPQWLERKQVLERRQVLERK